MPALNEVNSAKVATNHSIERFLALLFVVVIGLSGLCAYILWEARQGAWKRAAEVAASLASTIENEVSRNVESIDLSLQAVIDNLNKPSISRLDPETRWSVLFNRSATIHDPGAIMVFNEQGNLKIDSRVTRSPQINMADREYFQVHEHSTTAGLYISRPMIARLSGQWIVALSRRMSHPDGAFAGVVMASLRLNYFQKLFQQALLGQNGNITLSRTDGVVLMRWPYEEGFIGSNIGHAKLYKKLKESPSGTFETISATDGVHRLIVYRQIGNLPLVIGVGQSTADIFVNWRSYAIGIAAIVAILLTTILLLSWYLIRELRQRRNFEAILAIQALTDSLSKLSNRRHFNQTLRGEWKRAARGRQQLSLIMLDADKFKIYNDTFGHQAGDTMLKTIGVAIADCVKRSGDLGARVGGDEFALLLPDTSAEGAKSITEAIRKSFIEHCQHDGVVPTGLSIGIACMAPGADHDEKVLLEAADHALYEAKRRGRNRTEIASVELPSQAEASQLGTSRAA